MLSLNSAFEEELYVQYLRNPESVSNEWRKYFDSINNKSVSYVEQPRQYVESEKPKKISEPVTKPAQEIKSNYEQLNSLQAKVAENMELSLEIPTATSVRTIPVKALDENRRIINKYLIKQKRPKVSFTHLLAWAIVKAIMKYPQMNYSYQSVDGKPYRVKNESVNIGFAVDLTRNDGSRLLLVPNIKDSQKFNFSDFIRAFDVILNKARNNKLELDDLVGTTVTITNPGMIGTTFSSPRLMKNQGLIVATGSIDYPVEFQAVRPEALTQLAVSKVVTVTSTYDHRVIQGAESAEFLAYINKLLLGEEHFYDQIFANLKIPFEPIRWALDRNMSDIYGYSQTEELIEKGAHVVLMINSYRVRGHLLASTNPLGLASYYYPELDPAYYGFTIWDLDRKFHTDDAWGENNLPLRDIIELIRETYCGPIGVEIGRAHV